MPAPLFFTIITVIVAIGAAVLTTYLVDVHAGIAAFFSVVLIGFCIGFGLGVAESNRTQAATRAALEERYDVDFSTGSLGYGKATFIKDGDLYTCTITGRGNEARMFCDEPPRNEYVK